MPRSRIKPAGRHRLRDCRNTHGVDRCGTPQNRNGSWRARSHSRRPTRYTAKKNSPHQIRHQTRGNPDSYVRRGFARGGDRCSTKWGSEGGGGRFAVTEEGADDGGDSSCSRRRSGHQLVLGSGMVWGIFFFVPFRSVSCFFVFFVLVRSHGTRVYDIGTTFWPKHSLLGGLPSR